MKHGRLRRQLVNGTDWTFENKLLKPSTMDVYWGTRAKELLRKSKDRLIKSRISLIIDSHNIHNSPKQILAILRPFVQIQSSNQRHLRSSATERFPNILPKVCVCRKIKGDSAKKNDELEQADWRKNGINYVNQTECIGFQRWKVNNGRKSPMYWSHLSVRLLYHKNGGHSFKGRRLWGIWETAWRSGKHLSTSMFHGMKIYSLWAGTAIDPLHCNSRSISWRY